MSDYIFMVRFLSNLSETFSPHAIKLEFRYISEMHQIKLDNFHVSISHPKNIIPNRHRITNLKLLSADFHSRIIQDQGKECIQWKSSPLTLSLREILKTLGFYINNLAKITKNVKENK